ncbi:MAG: GNAT family N-acetyltransferase [Bdellovibrionia bacterium]
MSRPLIRVARPEDDSVIGELLINAYVTQYARKMPEVVVDENRKKDLRDVAGKRRIGTVLVAELDGKVVGSVTLLKPGAPRSEAWREQMADLRMFGIDLNYRGQGIADALLDEAERIVREDWKCPTLGLHVRRGAHGVAGVYIKRGFQRDPSGDLDKLPEIFLEAYVKTLL